MSQYLAKREKRLPCLAPLAYTLGMLTLSAKEFALVSQRGWEGGTLVDPRDPLCKTVKGDSLLAAAMPKYRKNLDAVGMSPDEHHDFVRKFLVAGADPNLLDRWGYNALWWANESNFTTVIPLLLAHGANLFHQVEDPKHYAAGEGLTPLFPLLGLYSISQEQNTDLLVFYIRAGLNPCRAFYQHSDFSGYSTVFDVAESWGMTRFLKTALDEATRQKEFLALARRLHQVLPETAPLASDRPVRPGRRL
jgi:hypothetical protein